MLQRITYYSVYEEVDNRLKFLFHNIMNFSKLIYLMSCWSFSNAEPAIFFKLEEKKLVEVGEYAEEMIWESCISVCPAASNSPTEKLLNDNISITGNGLFLRDIYSKPIVAKEVEKEICDNRYTPAVVFDDVLRSYEVGYELYYKKGKTELTSHMYDYLFKIIHVPENVIEISKISPTKDVIVYKDQGKPVFKIAAEPDIKYGFYWIKVLAFEMRNRNRHRIITYTPDTINDFFHKHNIMNNCEFYYAGDGRKTWDKDSREEDEEAHVETVDKSSTKMKEPEKENLPRTKKAEKENRETLEKNITEEDEELEIHQTPDETPSTSKEPEEAMNHLVKTQIIPMHMFHTVAARLATCAYLNFAFIWEAIAKNQLKEVDLFLYAIYREWPLETTLLFGVNVYAQHVDPIAWTEIMSEDHLIRQFPVPEVVFRIIHVYLEKNRYFGAVVVVHNVLEPVKDTDRICSAQHEMNSWNYIKNTNHATGFSYVCPLKRKILIKLKAELRSEFFYMKPLNIDEFPLLDEKNYEIRHENVLERIEKRLQDIKNTISD